MKRLKRFGNAPKPLDLSQVGGGVGAEGLPKNDAVDATGMEPEVDDENSAQRLFIVWMQVKCVLCYVVSTSRTPLGALRPSPFPLDSSQGVLRSA